MKNIKTLILIIIASIIFSIAPLLSILSTENQNSITEISDTPLFKIRTRNSLTINNPNEIITNYIKNKDKIPVPSQELLAIIGELGSFTCWTSHSC